MNQDKIKEKLKNNKRILVLLALIVIVYIVFICISDSFGTINTLVTLIYSNAALAISAIGMTYIILTGGIDLSAGASIAFTGAVTALTMTHIAGDEGMGIAAGIAGIIVSIIVGALVGTLNGCLITFFHVSPFMVTLATQCLCRGLALSLTNSNRIVIKNEIFVQFGQGSLGNSKIPIVLLVMVLLYLFSNFLLKKTTFGRHTVAVGGNETAAKFSGIHSRKQIIMVYAFAGLMTGIATVFTIGRAISAQPLAATDLEFEIITAVVIGGTSLMGGVGSIVGTTLGAVLVALIRTGLNMMNVSPYLQYVIKGFIIILAVLMDGMGSNSKFQRKKRVEKTASTAETVQKGSSNQEVARLIKEGKQKCLKLNHIHKSFPGVKALDDVSLEIKAGTVHALIGENGAGKSTLMKILSGVYTKDEGMISIDGIPVDIKSPMDSAKLGIQVIYQEFALIPELSAASNIFLGKEIKKKDGLKLDKKEMREKAEELLARFGVKINVQKKVSACMVGQQQMIEIAKAFSSDAWVIVMDEPTSAITEKDKENLFKIIRNLKAKGLAVVYISHRMPEIFEIADEVTVLRDGKTVHHALIEELDEQTLIKHMVGRSLNNIFDREKGAPGEKILEVRNLGLKNVFQSVNFSVHAGEVLGFSGLMGAGRTEIMRCLFGLDKPTEGQILLEGKEVHFKSPLDAIKNGIGLVPEDRRREGIVPMMSVLENISLISLPWISKAGMINEKEEKEMARRYIEQLNIKTPGTDQYIVNLSGGNQQKCCLAKCLARSPKVVILDEPTRGIDVGAKAEIHKLIDTLTKAGNAVILISSELPEVIGASDRIIVLHEGMVTGEFCVKDGVTQEVLLEAASGS